MNPAIALRETTEAEFAEFRALAMESYASDNAASGRWPAHEAHAFARAEIDRLLPQGARTPGHEVRATIEMPEGSVVGYVWFGEVPRGSQRVAFVYQLIIKPQYRRRGYGRAAMLAAEQAVRAAGCAGMALHVFSHNDAAVSLYKSVGFLSTSINMHKPLVP